MAAKKRERLPVYWVDDNDGNGPVRVLSQVGRLYDKVVRFDTFCAGHHYRRAVQVIECSFAPTDAIKRWRFEVQSKLEEAEEDVGRYQRLLDWKITLPKEGK